MLIPQTFNLDENNDSCLQYTVNSLAILDCLTGMTETDIEGCDLPRDVVHMLYEVGMHPISPCMRQLGVCVLQYVP